MRYLFVTILGSLLHFAYEWSGNNFIVGLFSPINESVWEHLKLLFFPMLFLTLWDYFVRENKNTDFLSSRALGILAGMGFIITAYYTITGVIGKNIDWLNIVIFLLGVLVSFLVERTLSQRNSHIRSTAAIAILITFIVLFAIFTVAPPEIGLFESKPF